MKLVIEFSNNTEIVKHEIVINVKTTVGRSSKSTLQIKDDKTSSLHCQFLLTMDGLSILDLNSKNGIYLNGIRIESSEIFIGDEIRIGQTTCIIDEKLSDSDALELLTFPGRTKERIAFELRADFTGARTLNQMNFKNHQLPKSILPPVTLAKEISLRKKAKSPIRVSKSSIHDNNQVASTISTIIDYGLLLLTLIIPFYVTNHFFQLADQLQILAITGSGVLLSSGNFYIYNFKRRKFTIGEKLSGIERLYLDQ